MQKEEKLPIRKKLLVVSNAIGSILLGLAYLRQVFGPTETEVRDWGKLSLYTGILLAFLWLAIGQQPKKFTRIILALGYFFVALLQILPILLWFLFHGYGISDGSPPSAFVAHWGYALPHIALLVISVMLSYTLLAQNQPKLKANLRNFTND